jgi:hypothetical protein
VCLFPVDDRRYLGLAWSVGRSVGQPRWRVGGGAPRSFRWPLGCSVTARRTEIGSFEFRYVVSDPDCVDVGMSVRVITCTRFRSYED